ncbi:MAG: 4Fe-4S binding protein [Nitrososphaerota archaeon]
MLDISINFLGTEFRNPLIAAPGPWTKDYESIKHLFDAGIGGIVTKTIVLEKSRNPSPCLYRGKGYFLNTERCSTIALEQWISSEMPRLRTLGIPIIASIGMHPEEVSELAPQIVASGAHMIELSIFTPYNDPSPLIKAIKLVKQRIDVPVIAKLSFNVHDIVEFGLAAKDAGADGLSAIDAIKAGLDVDILTGVPTLYDQGFGRVSGEAIRAFALYSLALLTHYVKLPIIGIGGIMSGEDAVKMIYCGASLVGICTALIICGPSVISKILNELKDTLRKIGASSLAEIRGKTVTMIDFPESPDERLEYEKRIWRGEKKVASIETDKCVKCEKCQNLCVYHAIQNFQVVAGLCQGCGLCRSICPTGAIRFC